MNKQPTRLTSHGSLFTVSKRDNYQSMMPIPSKCSTRYIFANTMHRTYSKSL
jgi:hypothetical protein